MEREVEEVVQRLGKAEQGKLLRVGRSAQARIGDGIKTMSLSIAMKCKKGGNASALVVGLRNVV